jgi:4-hydroxybenzoate polyprenyltransferase
MAAAHMGWIVVSLDPDNAESCLSRFRANSTTGWIVFVGLLADGLLRL